MNLAIYPSRVRSSEVLGIGGTLLRTGPILYELAIEIKVANVAYIAARVEHHFHLLAINDAIYNASYPPSVGVGGNFDVVFANISARLIHIAELVRCSKLAMIGGLPARACRKIRGTKRGSCD
jgi:hypothetical protein